VGGGGCSKTRQGSGEDSDKTDRPLQACESLVMLQRPCCQCGNCPSGSGWRRRRRRKRRGRGRGREGRGGRSHRIVWAARETAIDIFLDYFTLTSLVHSVRLAGAGLGWAAGRGRSVKGREGKGGEGRGREVDGDASAGWSERERKKERERTSQPQRVNDHHHEWANLCSGITNGAG
jgi:hypothetical protein